MASQTLSPVKDKYKVKNWKAYNENLRKRGSITLWLDEDVLQIWGSIDFSQKTVGYQTYPDCIILCCLLISMQYGLALRQTTGFIESLLLLMGKFELKVPDYTTLCRRKQCLPVELSNRLQSGEKVHVAIDSTGLKVYGEGEWKVRKYGASKRRTWRKLHVAIDIETQEIIAVELTLNDVDDAQIGAEMLKNHVSRVESFRGDGAYDDFKFRKVLGNGVKQIIPPPIDAVQHPPITKKGENLGFLQQRNQAIEYIAENGRKSWKQNDGYHRRSLNETTMFRYKTSFTHQLSARKFENQKTEVKIGAKILNIYAKIGLPVSIRG